MKKLLVIVFAFVIVMALGACSNSNDASQPSTNNDGATPISKGYSIQSLGLDLNDDSGELALTEGKYSPDVKINGKYTAIIADENTAYVQGFYKEDLQTEKVYIGGRVLSESDLADKAIYQTEDIIVYDITSYIDGECCNFNYELNVIDSINTPQTTETDDAGESSANL